MKTTSEDVVKQFFDAYAKHDMQGIREVMSENVIWTFNGNHPFAGVKKGIDELIEFFDAMGAIMSVSKPQVDKTITASSANHFIECQHIQTNRPDGINISHDVCVLWTFENGKITSGRHFFADPQAVDRYFTQAAEVKV